MKRFIFVFFVASFFIFSCKKNISKDIQAVSEELANPSEDANNNGVLLNGENDFLEDEKFLEQKNEILPDVQTESVASKSLKNANGYLRLFLYQDEQFLVLGNKDRKIVQYADGKAFRKFFDESFRLEKKEIWKIAKTLEESKKESTEFYFYNGDNVNPFKSELKTDKTKMENFFDEKSHLIEQKIYNIKIAEELDPKKNIKKDTEALVKKSNWKYDEENRVVEETHILYTVLPKKVEQFEKKMNYKYDSDGSLVEYVYFENGSKRIETKYISEDTYTTLLFFDNLYSVEAVYSDGKKKKEVFMYNQKVLREKEYE